MRGLSCGLLGHGRARRNQLYCSVARAVAAAAMEEADENAKIEEDLLVVENITNLGKDISVPGDEQTKTVER